MASVLTRSVSQLASSRTHQVCYHFRRVNVVNNRPTVTALVYVRLNTSAASISDSAEEEDGPGGDLFLARVGPELLGKSAWTRRTFEPRSNALSLLTCGGEALAKHASFDPEYQRARDWIRHHAVGPAVLSPVLINGLVGALVEASVPQSIPMSSSMNQIRPLIVGVRTIKLSSSFLKFVYSFLQCFVNCDRLKSVPGLR
jgi:hypothetical protein